MKPLIQALTKAKQNFAAIGRDGEAKVQTKNGREYSYRYTTLDDILSAVTPALAKEGLHVYHTPRIMDRAIEITCHVTDGEFTLSAPVVLPLSGVDDAKNPAQSMGSLLTYGKRYSVCALLGLCATEDDDAQAVETSPESKPAVSPSVPRIVPRTEPEAPRFETDDPILKGKLEWCKRKFDACGVRSEDRPAIIAAATAGKDMPELAMMIAACTGEGQRA